MDRVHFYLQQCVIYHEINFKFQPRTIYNILRLLIMNHVLGWWHDVFVRH